MKKLWPLPVVLYVFLCLTGAAFGSTISQTDRALAIVADSVRQTTSLLQEGVSPSQALPKDVAAKVLGPIRMISEPGVLPTPFDPTYLIHCLDVASKQSKSSDQIADYQSVLGMIVTMRAQVQTLKHIPADNSAQVRSLVNTELSSNQYGYDKPPDRSMIDKFGDWLGKQISAMLARFHPRVGRTSNIYFPPGLATTIEHVLVGLLILVCVAILTFLIVLVVRAIMNRRAGVRILAGDDAAEAALLEARDSDSILSRANLLADSGEYRKAFRLIYLATLVTLDTDGILHFDRSRTNWEYLRALRRSGRPDLYELLAPFTREFDRIWYGFGSVDASTYALAVNRYTELKSSTIILPTVQTARKPTEAVVKQ